MLKEKLGILYKRGSYAQFYNDTAKLTSFPLNLRYIRGADKVHSGIIWGEKGGDDIDNRYKHIRNY